MSNKLLGTVKLHDNKLTLPNTPDLDVLVLYTVLV